MGVNIGGRNMGASIGTRNVMSMSDNPPLPVPVNRISTIASVNGNIGMYRLNIYNLQTGWYEFELCGGGGGGASGSSVVSANGYGGTGGNGGFGTTISFSTTKRVWFVNLFNMLEKVTGDVVIVAGGGGGGGGKSITNNTITNGYTGKGGKGGGNAGGAGGGGARGVNHTSGDTATSNSITNYYAKSNPTFCGTAGSIGGTINAAGGTINAINNNNGVLGPIYGGSNISAYAVFHDLATKYGNGYSGVNPDTFVDSNDAMAGRGGGYPAGVMSFSEADSLIGWQQGIGNKGINLQTNGDRAYQGGITGLLVNRDSQPFSIIYPEVLTNGWYDMADIFPDATNLPGGGTGGTGGIAGTNGVVGGVGGNGAKIKCVIYIPEPVTIAVRTGGGGEGGIKLIGAGGGNGANGANGSAIIYKLG